jgi:hypothetical protein
MKKFLILFVLVIIMIQVQASSFHNYTALTWRICVAKTLNDYRQKNWVNNPDDSLVRPGGVAEFASYNYAVAIGIFADCNYNDKDGWSEHAHDVIVSWSDDATTDDLWMEHYINAGEAAVILISDNSLFDINDISFEGLGAISSEE